MKMDCEALFWGLLFMSFPLCCCFYSLLYSDSGELHVHKSDLEQCHYFYL